MNPLPRAGYFLAFFTGFFQKISLILRFTLLEDAFQSLDSIWFVSNSSSNTSSIPLNNSTQQYTETMAGNYVLYASGTALGLQIATFVVLFVFVKQKKRDLSNAQMFIFKVVGSYFMMAFLYFEVVFLIV